MIYKGSSGLKAYVGSTGVAKMYLGDVLVYGGGEDMSGYIIDQTGSVTTASDRMITVNSGVFNRIKQIHDNTHLYAGGLVNGVLQVKQLSDANKALYADGTPLALGADEDVFVKLPQFWWKVTPDADNEDICEVNFTMEDPDDNTWYEWEGDTFIGAYKGVVTSSRLRSRPGGLISATSGSYTRTSRNNYKTYARNNGTGFSCLTYEVVHIMALLGFGWLRTLSARSVFSYGTTSDYTTGVCDSLGMVDGGVSNVSSYWGMEGYITGSRLSEYIDNLTRNSTNLISILDPSDNSVVRTVQAKSPLNGNYYVQKVVLGSHADIFAKEAITTRLGTNVQYVCYTNINNTGFYFGNSLNSSNTGFVGIVATSAQGSTTNTATSRLCYKGSYQII